VLAGEAEGSPTEFLFFWGHQPQPDGAIGASCMSQWWPPSFTAAGVTYPIA
jgi:predicted NAD-dependent protein-ADP-ribosyltransferase YbiA (DUF1768 family)